jgi:DNA repair protein RadA
MSENIDSDLTKIPGIGKVTAKKLIAEGINTYEDFINSDPKQIAKIVKSSEEKVRIWVQNAKELILEDGIEISDEEIEAMEEAIEMVNDEFDEDQPRKKSSKKKIDYDISDLPGVGAATTKKLKEAGLLTVRAIAVTPKQVIMDEAGIGDKSAEKLIRASQELLNLNFKTASEIWEERKNLKKISTGSANLDEILGGGIETKALTEFYGEYRTGKTQLMHQLCVNVQLTEEKGGLEGRALYIDAEGTFRPERIIQMAEGLDLDYKKVLQNITFARAYNSDHQIMLVKDASHIIEEKNIKLIVVDSLIGHFRSEYIGRGTLAERQQILNSHLHDLIRLTEIYSDLAILVTNQVQSKPDVFYGNPLRATGGNIMAHGSTIRVYLRKGKDDQRVAKIVDAPHLAEAEAIFTISEDGIRD